MRSVHLSASTPVRLFPACSVSAPCLASSGTRRCFSASAWSSHIHLPARPFLRAVLLPSPLVVRAPDHLGTMRALTPAPLRRRSRPLRSIRLPSRHPAPNHAMQPGRHVLTTSCDRPVLAVPGFALNEQARHCTPPNRVRVPTGCRFASGCSPPRLAATQLPPATCAVTSHGTDSH